MPEEPTRLRDLLEDAGRRLGMGAPVQTGMLWARWREVVGDAIAEHARPTSLRRGVLRVAADSPAWATEIGYLSEQIRGAANRALGGEVVQEVRVWTGRLDRSREASSPVSPGSPAPPKTGGETDPVRALERARKAWAARTRRPPADVGESGKRRR